MVRPVESAGGIVHVLTWIVSVIVSLAVGSAMINGVLTVPMIPNVVTVIAGWVVVIGAIVSLIMAIFKK